MANSKDIKPRRASKYDWVELEKQWLLSDHTKVTEFFRELGIGMSPDGEGLIRYFYNKTKGWTAIKKRIEAEKQKELTKRLIESQTSENAKALIQIMKAVRMKIKDEKAIEALSVVELEKIWEMLMTMNGLPTKVYRNVEQPPTGRVQVNQQNNYYVAGQAARKLNPEQRRKLAGSIREIID